MQWRSWIVEAYARRANETRPEFHEGVSPEQLARLETELGCRLPRSLGELLRETDGVKESMCYGGTWFDIYTPLWSCEQMAEQNRTIRGDPNGPRPPNNAGVVPLYFASASVDGILFAFLVQPSGPEDPPVYAYYPIEGKWRLVSPSLKEHLHGWKV